MAKIDYSEILGKQVGSAPEPKPLPEGTYTGVISGLPKPRTISTKEGEKGLISFKIAITEAMTDVDEDLLAESGGLRRNDGQPRQVTKDFWLDEASMYQLDRFLATLGYGAETNPGKSYTDIFEELDGKEVTFEIANRTYTQNGEEKTVADVKRIFATEG